MKMQPGFGQQVWYLTSQIPRGRVTTYGILAHKLGSRACRAVGNALNRNPHWPDVPCHRVARSTGEVGGFASGTKKKIALLREEGIEISKGRIINLERYLHRFA